MTKLVESLDCKSINKLLVDFRGINFNKLNIEILDELLIFRKKFLNHNHYIVQIVDDPNVTVITYLYQEKLNKENNNNYSYCSTVSKAIELLKLNKTTGELELIINNLEYSF